MCFPGEAMLAFNVRMNTRLYHEFGKNHSYSLTSHIHTIRNTLFINSGHNI